MADPRVLIISKPVVPPWTDSGKNLVRDIVTHTPDVQFHVFVTKGAAPPAPGVVTEAIYGDAGSYAPSLLENVKVLGRLARPDRIPLYHFFFAPNPKTSTAARWILRMKRRRSVHTIMSRPRDVDRIARLMFADRVVALSDHTRTALERAGVQGVVTIPPAVPEEPPLSEEARRAVRERYGLGDDPIVLYAGDYEFSGAAGAVAEAAVRLVARHRVRVVFACRLKTAAARGLEAEIRERVRQSGVADHVTFLNEIDDMRALIATAAVQVQPAGSLYAKMDLPLVLIESLREGVPIVIAQDPPLGELLRDDVGLGVPAEDGPALAAAVGTLLGDEGRRRAVGDAGRRVAALRYSPVAMGQAYGRLYQELLGSP